MVYITIIITQFITPYMSNNHSIYLIIRKKPNINSIIIQKGEKLTIIGKTLIITIIESAENKINNNFKYSLKLNLSLS